jgi:hypothetical protein
MSDEVPPPVTVRAGQIQFFEACHPPLVAGQYGVQVSQDIRESETALVPWNSDPYAAEMRFAVDAPRFMLKPADIHSVYPPSNQRGRFDNALPHVVFTRRTLPWERTLDGTPPTLGHAFPSWMGLLLVQEDELLIRDAAGQTTNRKHEIQSLPVTSSAAGNDSLLFPRDQNVLAPDLGQHGAVEAHDSARKARAARWQKDRGRHENESCLAIDLPAAFFKAIAPRAGDLPYLAHVRQIDTGEKEVRAINDRGWFSLVIGNRLPQANKDHRAFLVSLEGFQALLGEDWIPQPGQMVRLAVLGAWSFTCEGANDFKAHMRGLTIDSLHLPFRPFADHSTAAGDIVNGAYARGYTALDHVMRHGERTVSWYRGPLVPLNYNKPKQIQDPVSCADELLRYDPDTGLFDATYAAAWQLGRLLALQNHGFALALSRARATMRAEAQRRMRTWEIEQLGLPRADSLEDSLMAQLADGAGDELLKAVSGEMARRNDLRAPGPAPGEAVAQSEASGLNLHARQIPQATRDETLEEVASWLARLVLLYGVPFPYLIPEEQMLPAGSLRFFFLDPIWIQCVVQGACSVGSNGYGDAMIDKAMNEWVQPNQPAGNDQANLPNRQAAGIRDRLRLQYEAVALPEEAAFLHWPLTGFLLRSPVVEGWRGLEVTAYRAMADEERRTFDAARLTGEQRAKLTHDGVAPLPALRIEQLSKDVMLGIFNGIIAQLVIRQPQEGLHFGLTRDGESYTKTLRELGHRGPDRAGQALPAKIDLSGDGMMRDQAHQGVVGIGELAKRMRSLLLAQGQLKEGKFTSAEFAVEMIEAACESTFRTAIRTAP